MWCASWLASSMPRCLQKKKGCMLNINNLLKNSNSVTQGLVLNGICAAIELQMPSSIRRPFYRRLLNWLLQYCWCQPSETSSVDWACAMVLRCTAVPHFHDVCYFGYLREL